MPDRVKSFRKVDSSKKSPTVRLGFAITIQNGLRKIKNLIQSGRSRAEIGLMGRKWSKTPEKRVNVIE